MYKKVNLVQITGKFILGKMENFKTPFSMVERN